jgi:cytochrome c oxidase assembly factor CtaG
VSRVRTFAAGVMLAATAGVAAAHPIDGPSAEAGPGWTLDPWITIPLAISAVLFATGLVRLRARAGAGRGQLDRRALLFAAGWLCLAGAVVSPLHEAGERAFSAHMLEHELLMLGAAPLLVMSWPIGAMLWAFPAGGRQWLARLGRSGGIQGPWRLLSDPVVATVVQAAALWLWHLPSLFDLALRSEIWHAVQHLSFLVSALFFWTAMLHGRRSLGQAVACLFFTSVISGALGAFMALSQSPWYARYAQLGMTPYGLTPAQDQQLAGLLMWIPGGLIHAVAAIILLGRALSLTHARAREMLPDVAQS